MVELLAVQADGGGNELSKNNLRLVKNNYSGGFKEWIRLVWDEWENNPAAKTLCYAYPLQI